MRLHYQALAFALGIVWGGAVLLTGLAHLLWPEYGGAFLDLASSIYPGFHPDGLGSVIVGTLYAVLDGAVTGVVLAWLYNIAAKPAPAAS